MIERDFERDEPGTIVPTPDPLAMVSTPDLLAGLRNGAWLDVQEFPELNYHVPLLVPEGMTLFVGPPKGGKSWFALDVALSTAAGGRALGAVPVDKRPVLYLALEDGYRRLQDRCRVLLRQDPIPEGFEYLITVEPGKAIPTLRAWFERHEGEKPIAILDTLGKVMPPSVMGESSYQRDYRIGGELKALTDEHPGAAVVICHHDRKANAEDFVDAVSGTHGLAGAADTILVLVRARNETDAIIKVTGRDVKEGEYALSFFGGVWKTVGSDLTEAARAARERRQAAGLGERATEVLEIVNRHPEGVTPAQVAAEMGDLDNHTAGTYLGRLLDAGRITKPKRGVYMPMETVETLKDFQQGDIDSLPGSTLSTQPHDLSPADRPSSSLAGSSEGQRDAGDIPTEGVPLEIHEQADEVRRWNEALPPAPTISEIPWAKQQRDYDR